MAFKAYWRMSSGEVKFQRLLTTKEMP